VVAIERAARMHETSQARSAIIVAGMCATLAWLIRGAGITLVVAGTLFMLSRSGRRSATGFLMVCFLSYAPWYLYSATHNSTEGARAVHGGDIVRGYGSPMASRSGERAVSIGDLYRRVSINVVNIFGRDAGAVIFPSGYRGAGESGLEVFLLAGATGLRAGSMGIGPAFVAISAVISVFILVGAFAMSKRGLGVPEYFCALTIAMLVLVPSHTFRYVLPIAPFFVLYFLAGVESVAAQIRPSASSAAVRIAAGCLLFFLLIEHSAYIWLKTQGPSPVWLEDGREVRSVTDFINQKLPARVSTVSTNPGLVYLATGHKAVAYVEPDTRWQEWKAMGVKYAVALHVVPKPSHALGYRLLYESPRLGLWVVELSP
jgi:hypothetical protein